MFGGLEWLIVILIVVLLIGGPALGQKLARKAGSVVKSTQDIASDMTREMLGAKTDLMKAAQRALVNSLDPLRVFLCSMQDETAQEREAVRTRLDQLKLELGLTRPIVFEDFLASPDTTEANFREAIERSDVFVIIVAEDISAPVLREYQFAVEYNKPCFFFRKETPNQSEQLKRFLVDVPQTWKYYHEPNELADLVTFSIVNDLLNNYRHHRLTDSDRSLLLMFVQSYGIEETVRHGILTKVNETIGTTVTKFKDGVVRAIEERKAAAEREREAEAERERDAEIERERELAAKRKRDAANDEDALSHLRDKF